VQAHFRNIQFIKTTCTNLGFNTVLLICKVYYRKVQYYEWPITRAHLSLISPLF